MAGSDGLKIKKFKILVFFGHTATIVLLYINWGHTVIFILCGF